MPDYSTLTDTEINAMLAENMGFKKEGTLFAVSGFPVYSKDGKDGWKQLLTHWAPCTCRDDLAVVVGSMDESQANSLQYYLLKLYNKHPPENQGSFLKYLLTCPPRVIAEACLEVLS